MTSSEFIAFTKQVTMNTSKCECGLEQMRALINGDGGFEGCAMDPQDYINQVEEEVSEIDYGEEV